MKGIYNKSQETDPNPGVQPKKQTNSAKVISTEDVFEQLEKLGKLRENGILTDAEFTEQKMKLLEQLQ
ncbi:SHOCT domain-containing protein [Chryseobacterium sp. G0186]|nr:SHOCT domain-containing protein [Chryseobacterium sp. G0186]